MQTVSRGAAERARMVESYKASGLSVRAFAEQESIPPSTLYLWLAKEHRPNSQIPIARVIRRPRQRQPAVVVGTTASVVIETGSLRIRIADGVERTTLETVLDVIESRRREVKT